MGAKVLIEHKCELFGQEVGFISFDGSVTYVQNWTTQQTWSSGVGGWVDPRFGGYVQAPTIHSSSTHHIRVRVVWSDGKHSSVDLSGHIHVSVGDRLVLLAGDNKRAKIWQWTGVAILTTEELFLIGDPSDISKVRGNGIAEKLGFFLIRCLIQQVEGLIKLVIVGSILSVMSAAILSSVFQSDFKGYFALSAIALGIIAIIGSIKFTIKAKKAEISYEKIRRDILNSLLRPKLTIGNTSSDRVAGLLSN